MTNAPLDRVFLRARDPQGVWIVSGPLSLLPDAGSQPAAALNSLLLARHTPQVRLGKREIACRGRYLVTLPQDSDACGHGRAAFRLSTGIRNENLCASRWELPDDDRWRLAGPRIRRCGHPPPARSPSSTSREPPLREPPLAHPWPTCLEARRYLSHVPAWRILPAEGNRGPCRTPRVRRLFHPAIRNSRLYLGGSSALRKGSFTLLGSTRPADARVAEHWPTRPPARPG